MSKQPAAREHAVVIGASMGGLVAAAALAPHYRRVTILERDALPTDAAHRRGVPQSKHAHGLQPGGMRALDELLPDIMDQLIAEGAPTGDLSASCTWTIGGNRFASAPTGVPGIGLTRPFLENRVRARVAALDGVRIRDRVEVRRLLADGGGRVTGVEFATADGAEVELATDLVVDACGKVSKLPEWLTGLGYQAPEEETVHCKMAYLSRLWRLREEHARPDIVTVVTPTEIPHFGVMIRQEDGTHIVTLGGLLDQAPARTDADYLEFARNLPDPAIADALVDATPVTDLQPSHFPSSRRRRYDRLRAFPEGLLALGDSIAAFNPMYGQGMTVAALEAVALRDQLGTGPLNARKFFAKAHRIEDVAWKISTGGDLRYEAVVGKRTPDMKIMTGYLDKLGMGARTDPKLAHQFLLVAGFIKRPVSFFKPSVAWRVFTARRPEPQPAAVAARTPVTTS